MSQIDINESIESASRWNFKLVTKLVEDNDEMVQVVFMRKAYWEKRLINLFNVRVWNDPLRAAVTMEISKVNKTQALVYAFKHNEIKIARHLLYEYSINILKYDAIVLVESIKSKETWLFYSLDKSTLSQLYSNEIALKSVLLSAFDDPKLLKDIIIGCPKEIHSKYKAMFSELLFDAILTHNIQAFRTLINNISYSENIIKGAIGLERKSRDVQMYSELLNRVSRKYVDSLMDDALEAGDLESYKQLIALYQDTSKRYADALIKSMGFNSILIFLEEIILTALSPDGVEMNKTDIARVIKAAPKKFKDTVKDALKKRNAIYKQRDVTI